MATCDLCEQTGQPTMDLYDDETGYTETRCRNVGACTDRQERQVDAALQNPNVSISDKTTRALQRAKSNGHTLSKPAGTKVGHGYEWECSKCQRVVAQFASGTVAGYAQKVKCDG